MEEENHGLLADSGSPRKHPLSWR